MYAEMPESNEQVGMAPEYEHCGEMADGCVIKCGKSRVKNGPVTLVGKAPDLYV